MTPDFRTALDAANLVRGLAGLTNSAECHRLADRLTDLAGRLGAGAARVGPALPTDAGHPEYLKLLDEMRDLHVRKAQDYGRGADPFANVRASADFQVPAWVGTLIRANDKWHRVKSFIVNKRLVNEGVEDTLKDMAAYCLIALVLYREAVRWGGGDHDHPQEAAITPAVTVEQASRCTVCGWPLVAHPDPAVYVPTATAPGVGAVVVTEDDGDADEPHVVAAGPLEWYGDREHTRCGRYSILNRNGSWHGGYFPDEEAAPAAVSPPVGTPEAAREWCQEHSRKAGR